MSWSTRSCERGRSGLWPGEARGGGGQRAAPRAARGCQVELMNFTQAELNSWTACSALSPRVPAFYARHRVLKHQPGCLQQVDQVGKAGSAWCQSQWIPRKGDGNQPCSCFPYSQPTTAFPRNSRQNSCFSLYFPALFSMSFGSSPDPKAPVAVGMGLSSRDSSPCRAASGVSSSPTLVVWFQTTNPPGAEPF